MQYFLGSDSGPMHIASFVKTPVVVIYGPTNPVVNAPYEKNPHIMLRKDMRLAVLAGKGIVRVCNA